MMGRLKHNYRVEEDEIEDQTSAFRKKLEVERTESGGTGSAKGFKSHQVHESAQAKIEESAKWRKALGIREDYEEGGHWKKQEERLKLGGYKNIND